MMRAFFVAALMFVSCAAVAKPVSEKDRAAVIDAVAAHLETDYVDAKIGVKAAGDLRSTFKNGAFNQYKDGKTFADALSKTLQALTGDGHLNVEYSEKTLPETQEADEEFSAQENERWYGAHLNFGVEKVERLDGNIGLLDLRVFPPVDMGGDTLAAAMNVVAHMDALIIDLRNNGGGGGTVGLVAGYLFDAAPRPLSGVYDRPTDTLTQSFTPSYVPGARFGPDKPVYILISSKTFSAAEAFAYDMQALKRAVIVGEPSGGGAHPFEYVRIHPHFVLWSVTQESVNPITHGNWQGVGVQPDIRVPADEALDAALKDLKSHAKKEK